jgi:hypothetical protein
MRIAESCFALCLVLFAPQQARAFPLVTQAGEEIGTLDIPAGITLVTLKDLETNPRFAGETVDFLANLEDRRGVEASPVIWRLSRIEGEYFATPANLEAVAILANLRATLEAQRRHDPYFPIERLEGFPVVPTYDRRAESLSWALRIRFREDQHDTIKYSVVILLRRGFLMVSGAGRPEQLPQMRDVANELATGIRVREGHRHGDFDPKTDLVSHYSLVELVRRPWFDRGTAGDVSNDRIRVAIMTASVGLVLFALPALWRRRRKA